MYKVIYKNRKFLVDANNEFEALQKVIENVEPKIEVEDRVSPSIYHALHEMGYSSEQLSGKSEEEIKHLYYSKQSSDKTPTQPAKTEQETEKQSTETVESTDTKKQRNVEITTSWKSYLNKPEIQDMYSRIKNHEYYSVDELKDSEFVKEMDKAIDEYDNNNSDERGLTDDEKETIYSELIKHGSYNPETKKYDGELKQERKAVIAIGLPASGKSSRIVNTVSPEIGGYVMDSDEAKFLSKAFQETNGLAANKIHTDSQDVIHRVFDDMIKNGTNVVVPIIGNDIDKVFTKWINPLQKQGYDVEVKYQPADSQESINRVISRTIGSGRPIKSSVVFGYGDGPARTYEQLKSMTNAQGKPFIRETVES